MSLKLAGFKIKQSQRITVSRDEEDKRQFVSSVEYTDDRKISITVPLHNQIPLELRRGETVYVRVPMNSFSLEFSSRVVSYTSENILLVNLEQPQSCKRVQRRGTVRFKLLLNIRIALLPGDPKEQPLFKDAVALDLSAGGLEFMTTEQYQRETFVLVAFHLEVQKNKTNSFLVKSLVRRVIPISPRKFKVGVQFLDLSMADTDRIFQYIFKKSAEKDYWKK